MSRTTLPPLTETLRIGREIWQASTDGWTFRRTEEPGTPWYAEESGTHLLACFGTLRDARMAAAGTLHETLLWNVRRELIRDGKLASHRALARYRCSCGGLLTDTPDMLRFRHIDGCLECVAVDTSGEDPNLAEPATEPRTGEPCRAADMHVLCRDPEPVLCARCDKDPVWIDRGACDCGRDDCCGGCCMPEEPTRW